MNNLDSTKEQLIAKQWQSEKALRESEDLYRVILEKSPIAIELYDPKGALIHVNQSCLDLFGVDSIDEIHGFLLFNDPNLNNQHKEKLLRGESLRYQDCFDFEKVKNLKLYKTKRSGTICLDVLITPIEGKLGSVIGYLAQIQDITSQKHAEEALQITEEQFRKLYNDAPIGLYRTTPDGKILLANRAIFDMLGFSSIEELSARNLKSSGFGPSYQREFFVSQIEKTGEVKDLEAKWIRSNGDVIIVLENAKAIRDENGNTLYYDGSVADITDRKRTEDALAETEKRYEQLVTNIQDAVYSVDGETGEFTYLSPAFGKLLGYTLDDIQAMGGRKVFLSSVLPSGKSNEHLDRFNQLQSKVMKKTFTDELWWRAKDGSLKCISDHWTPVYIEGKLISTDGVLRDITERKQAEEALNELLVRAEASDRLKTAFLNNISHEVRTPLNGILGFVEMMDDPDMTPADKVFYREILQMSSNRLLSTINSYMDISLIVSGNMSVNNSVIDLNDLIIQVHSHYHQQAAAKGVNLAIEASGLQLATKVNSDPELLRKVLDHLVENAIKFTEKGSIMIGTRMLEHDVEVSVKDSGIGIHEELMDRIFDTFLQADVSITRKHEGSGLGLAIVKGIIELLGGKIWVKSIEGAGSTFAFTIPKDSVAVTPSELSGNTASVEPETRPLVLIAEDDQINILLLVTMLNKTRANVWHVENGLMAVECCRQHPEVSLVLMDLKMPEMDGFEATRQIKSFRPGLPIIAVTAFAMPGDRDRAINAGCDDYMSKPFSSTDLKNKLKDYINL
jgi:PAS domain S-box-containing protein